MTTLPYNPDQVGNIASQYIAAHGEDEWYRCYYAGSALEVPDDLAAKVSALDPELDIDLPRKIEAECVRRIKEIISTDTQAALTGAIVGGLLGPNDMQAYSAGMAWLSGMRAKCAELIANSDTSYTADTHWPKADNKFVNLVRKF